MAATVTNCYKRRTYAARDSLVTMYGKSSKKFKTTQKAKNVTTLIQLAGPRRKDNPTNKSKDQGHDKGKRTPEGRGWIDPIEANEVTTLIERTVRHIDDILKQLNGGGESQGPDPQTTFRKVQYLKNSNKRLEKKVAETKGQLAVTDSELAPTPLKAAVNGTRTQAKCWSEIKKDRSTIMEQRTEMRTRITGLMACKEQSKASCKQTYDVLQSLRAHIHVCCRIKLLNISRSSFSLDFLFGEYVPAPQVTCSNTHTVPLLLVSGHSYIFDHIITPEATQSEVFNVLVPYIYKGLANGTSVCCIAHGESGSGKRYSITGPLYNPAFSDLVSDLSGVVPRVLSKALEERWGKMACRAFTVGPLGVEGVLSVAGRPEAESRSGSEKDWVVVDTYTGASQVAREFAQAADHGGPKHCVLQLAIQSEKLGRRGDVKLTFAILADVKTRCDSGLGQHESTTAGTSGSFGKDEGFVGQTAISVAEVLKVLVDVKLRNRMQPNYKSSTLTKLLADTLTPECEIVLLSHILNQDSPGTQRTLNFLREASLLI